MDRDCKGLGQQPQDCVRPGQQHQGLAKYGLWLSGQGPPQDLRQDKLPPIGSRFTRPAIPRECALPVLALALPLPPHKEREPVWLRAGEGLLPEHLPVLKGEIDPPPEDLGNAAEASPAPTPWKMSPIIRHPGGDEISPI